MGSASTSSHHPGPKAVALDVQYAIGVVLADDGGDVQSLAALAPERRRRVERRAVGLEVDHSSMRAGDRRADCEARAAADGAAREREVRER